jgi:hypothetical protein
MHHPFRSVLAAGLLAAALAGAPAPARAAAPPDQVTAAVNAGVAWIRTRQDVATGNLAGFGGDWSLTALAAAGVDAADVHGSAAGAPSAQDFFLGSWTDPTWTAPTDATTLKNASGYVATDFERAILLAHAAGLQPTRLSAQSNLVAQLAGLYNGGAYGAPGLFNGTVFGLLALARTPVPQALLDRSVQVIRDNEHSDGGWNYSQATTAAQKAGTSDIDMTGATLAALCDGGVPATDTAVAAGLSFLEGKLDNATGAFNAQFGKNADSNAWAVEGLNACGVDPQSAAWTTAAGKTPVDYLIALQRTTGANAGSFKYASTESDGANPNLYATQDAVRALAGESFSAEPPSVRPAPVVAAGTAVPVALVIDDGHGGVGFCRTTAPAGAALGDVLAAAQAASMPADCITALTVAHGRVMTVNGKAPDAPAGGWLVSLDGHPETLAGAQQPVGFGAIVALRLQHTALPAGSLSGSAGADFGSQPVGTLGAPQAFTFTAHDYPVRPSRAFVAGDAGDDFVVSGDGCAGVVVQPGETCTVRVRFAPDRQRRRAGRGGRPPGRRDRRDGRDRSRGRARPPGRDRSRGSPRPPGRHRRARTRRP